MDINFLFLHKKMYSDLYTQDSYSQVSSSTY